MQNFSYLCIQLTKNSMKRKFIITMLGCLAWSVIQAQTARTLTVTLSDDTHNKMVGYLPTKPTGKAVVCCPGSSIQHEGHDWAKYFNRLGIAYFVTTCRNRGDAEKAMLTVRDSANVWRINPYAVGIMGFAEGGHLATALSSLSEFAARPNFSILFYPIIPIKETPVHRHLTPPAIILTANDDTTASPVNNAVAYYTAMRRQGNDCALYIYPTGGHGFGDNSSFAYHQQMLNDLTTWLQAHHEPEKNAVRVACIGNSITDGFGIDMATQLGYPAQLQQLLGNGYHVKNFGVSSRTMLNKGDLPYQNELAWRDALAFRPDIVIIKLGTNDSKPENWQYNKGFKDDLQQMIDALRANKNNPRILLCTPIPAFKPTWNINDSVIVHGITPIINKVAKKNKLQVIDLHTLYANDGDKMIDDGIHPDARGARRMAEIIADQLKKEIK